MSSHEFGKYDLQPNSEDIDLGTDYTDDYHIDHAIEISEMLLSMEDETIRKPEMEKDAIIKARKIHEEIILHKGRKYQKMLTGISSVLNGGGVTVEIPENVDLNNKEYPFDYLISKCLQYKSDL